MEHSAGLKFTRERYGEMNNVYRPHHRITSLLRLIREWRQFSQRNYSAPSPTLLKMRTLVSFSLGEGNWVETGTYMGGTTQYLAKRFPNVISIEPSPKFYSYAKSRLRKLKNVTLLNGTSEDFFEEALIASTPIANVWLDGHFSDGGTFLGESVSPIIHELEVINRHKSKFNAIRVFVDDVRLFQRDELHVTGYPEFSFLVDWAQSNGFIWEIQNDIFIASYPN